MFATPGFFGIPLFISHGMEWLKKEVITIHMPSPKLITHSNYRPLLFDCFSVEKLISLLASKPVFCQKKGKTGMVR